MQKKTVRDVSVRGKKVLLRVDYNIPLSPDGTVADATRIIETLPTLKYLLSEGASVIVMSHFGRPKGKFDPKYTLRPAVTALSEWIHRPVAFVDDCVGETCAKAAQNLRAGDILMLENLRFHPEEEKNDPAFAKALASLGDLFVNDAFGTSHRAHASIVGIPKCLPAVAGFLLQKEIQILSTLREHPNHPYFAVLGGVKVSDKLGVLLHLLPLVDGVFIGGAMAFTFLKAQGFEVGKSLVEEAWIGRARELLQAHAKKIVLPTDCMAASFMTQAEGRRPVLFSEKHDDMKDLQGFDLGPQSILLFSRWIEAGRPKTVFWNGPMGVFEMPEFAAGTLEVAKILAKCALNGAFVVVGGGDSVCAVNELGLVKAMTHLSTGGGASLEFLEGKIPPGVAALPDSTSSVAQGFSPS